MIDARTAPVRPVPVDLVGIQHLRAIAALLVLMFHLGPQLVRMGYTGFWLEGLSSGVDIFFVISGLIMWVTTAGRAIKPGQFWWRRITRITPLYWLFTLALVLLLLAAPRLLQSSKLNWEHIIASFLFLAAKNAPGGKMEPLLVPGWTLNYEMFFYLIFGLWLLVPARFRLAGVTATLGLLVAGGVALNVERISVAGFYTSGIMLEFLFGMALGQLMTRGTALSYVPRWSAATMLAGGLVLALALPIVWPSPALRAATQGLPALVAVVGMMALEVQDRLPRLPILRLIGDASYSLYLSQVVILSALGQGWRRAGLTALPASHLCFALLASCVAIVGAILCYRYVERPVTAMFHPARWDKALVRFNRPIVAAKTSLLSEGQPPTESATAPQDPTAPIL